MVPASALESTERSFKLAWDLCIEDASHLLVKAAALARGEGRQGGMLLLHQLLNLCQDRRSQESHQCTFLYNQSKSHLAL